MKKITKEALIFLSLVCLLFTSGCSLKSEPSKLTSGGNEDAAKSQSSESSGKKNTSTIQDTNNLSAKTDKENKSTNYDTDPDNPLTGSSNLKYNTESIPVLMYHSVGDTNGNQLVISPALLDQEMLWLKDNGYTTLTLNEAYDFFTKNKPVPKKSVVLTFDDGYVDNYTNMYPIMKKYGFKATIFIITNTIDKNPAYLTSAQLKELDANGIDIESHTVNHDKLGTLKYQEQLETMKNSRLFLQKLLNRKVDFIAYPDGSYNSVTPKAAEDAGYTMAFTTDGRWSNKSNGIYKLYRVYISAFFNINTFEDRVTNPQYKIH